MIAALRARSLPTTLPVTARSSSISVSARQAHFRAAILQPLDTGAIEVFPVFTTINDPQNEPAGLIKRLG